MNKRPEKTEKTRNKICEAFWILHEKEQINKVYVSDIIKIAGVNRATFYRYYHDIYQIREEKETQIISYLKEHLEECLKNGMDQDMPNLLQEICRFYKTESYYLRILMGKYGDVSFVHSLKRELSDTISKHIPIKSMSSKNQMAFAFARGGIFELLQEWILEKSEVPIEEIYQISMDIIGGILHILKPCKA